MAMVMATRHDVRNLPFVCSQSFLLRFVCFCTSFSLLGLFLSGDRECRGEDMIARSRNLRASLNESYFRKTCPTATEKHAIF